MIALFLLLVIVAIVLGIVGVVAKGLLYLLFIGIVVFPGALLLVGFQNSATGVDLGVYAARRYSLMRPPRTGRRLIRFCERSAMGWSARGGWSWRPR
jgi:hypothetical protein